MWAKTRPGSVGRACELDELNLYANSCESNWRAKTNLKQNSGLTIGYDKRPRPEYAVDSRWYPVKWGIL